MGNCNPAAPENVPSCFRRVRRVRGDTSACFQFSPPVRHFLKKGSFHGLLFKQSLFMLRYYRRKRKRKVPEIRLFRISESAFPKYSSLYNIVDKKREILPKFDKIFDFQRFAQRRGALFVCYDGVFRSAAPAFPDPLRRLPFPAFPYVLGRLFLPFRTVLHFAHFAVSSFFASPNA